MTTRAEAIAAAGEVYGAILANPERRAELLAARRAAQTAASATSTGETSPAPHTQPARQSA